MLVAARDEDGTPSVFDGDDFGDVVLKAGTWVSTVNHDRCGLVISEFMCKGIPPGEKRVIDLEKSVIVHVAPPKTPVQELAEAAGEVLNQAGGIAGNADIDREDVRTIPCYWLLKMRGALARVRQEGGA